MNRHKNKTQAWRRSLVPASLIIVLALTGCAVGPDFKTPPPPSAQRYSPRPLPDVTSTAPDAAGAAQHFDVNAYISAQWWTLFRSKQLDTLIEKALKSNPGLAAAQAALKQAQESVYAQQGYFYPTAALSYSPSRQQLAGNMSGNAPGLQGNGTDIAPYQNPNGPPYNEPVIYTFHTAQLTVGYVPDVFGSNRRQVESLQAQSEMQRYQLEAARITLVSNVVAAALQEASLRAQIIATKDVIADNVKSLEISQRQFQLGYIMRVDLAAQESALAAAQQLLPPLEKQFEQTRDLIRVLVGNTPDEDVSETFELSDLHLPVQLPLSLPAQLVRQRPDVLAAEAQLHAASADVGVAVAARLPQFSINGAIGGEATVFNQMFQPGGPFWSLVGNVTQPIFDGNTLLHRERAADQALVQAAAQYRSTVLTALQNVADTLHAIQTDANALVAAANAEQAAKRALDLTRRQNELGYVNYLALLNAEQTYQQAAIALVQARAMRFGDTAALFQALGGGWWNDKEMVAQP